MSHANRASPLREVQAPGETVAVEGLAQRVRVLSEVRPASKVQQDRRRLAEYLDGLMIV